MVDSLAQFADGQTDCPLGGLGGPVSVASGTAGTGSGTQAEPDSCCTVACCSDSNSWQIVRDSSLTLPGDRYTLQTRRTSARTLEVIYGQNIIAISDWSPVDWVQNVVQ